MMAFPETLQNHGSQPVLSAALKPKSEYPLKRAALNIILELLNADEEKMGEDQRKKTEAQKNGKRQARAKKKSEAVAAENGELDGISVTSSIVQVALFLTSTSLCFKWKTARK